MINWLINSKTTDLIEVKAIPTWRCTSHKLALELHAIEKNGATTSEINEKLGSGGIRIGMIEGDLDNRIDKRYSILQGNY